MIKNFAEAIKYAKKRGPRTIAVAVAQDAEVLAAICEASENEIANAVLIGDC